MLHQSFQRLSIMTSFILFLQGPITFARTLPELEAQLTTAIEWKNQISHTLKPGLIYKNRLQVPPEQTQNLQEQQTWFNSTLKDLHEQLSLALFLQRASHQSVSENDFERYRILVLT